MPTSKKAIELNITTTTGTTPVRSYGNIGLVGSGNSGDYLVAQTFYNLSEVEDEYGSSSNLASGSQSIFAQNARKVTCVRASGTSATNIENALNVLDDEDVQIEVIAMDSNITNIGKLKAHAAAKDRIGVYMEPKNQVESISTANAATLASKNMIGVVHKSNQDVACSLAGVMSKYQPHIGLMWKKATGVSTDYYTNSEVEDFEAGKVNVLIDVGGNNVFSSDLTTYGGDYKFAWITRTEQYTKEQLEDVLVNLKLLSEYIPYTSSGFNSIESALRRKLNDFVTGGMLASFTLVMPDPDLAAEADKASGVVRGIEIACVLAGNVYEFVLSMNLTL